MSTKRITLITLLLILLVFIAWQINTSTTDEPAVKNSGKPLPIKAIYVKGSFSDELYQKQADLQKENKYYYIILDGEKTVKNFIKKYGLAGESENLNFTADFFTEKLLIAVFPEQGSSGVYFAATNVAKIDGEWQIDIEQTIPEGFTTDMINRGIFIEIDKNLLAKTEPVKINLKKIYLSEEPDKSELSIDDLQLGALKLKMTQTELDAAVNAKPIEVRIEQDGIAERRFYASGVEIVIIANEVSYIYTTSPNYPTPRSIKVGDDVDSLINTYGEPAQIQKGIYSYDLSDEYYLFHAKVENGKIVGLQVNLAD